MGSKQQPALRPSSTDGGCGGDGRAASVSERSSVTNASFRVYYSLRAGAVPFVWESAPGTPKRGAAAVSPESSLSASTKATSGGAANAGVATVLPPPPSPPPSYQSPFHGKGRRPSWTATPGGIVRALLGVLGLRKRHRRSRRRPDMSCL
ncbi:uncharacterized protein LOC119306567 [Triticum dicoccoides]|uniref:uncharacterized protein LOC119306567 n=1 Tax=Triticum dicoccoides TaxID=85692 RepID=UPI00188EF3E3|nr:uncharacterized protein LOC119306567 [Triticum dicoccoides]